ncbi:hypothetical protein WR25_01958 isoform C [Diploscapter pachys]|uniref:EamA domain-containing protein n=1 Tax=Diploscapter pachys TaxID=2018661 RepID=A0A2A2L103_9BILA|nr:hypothetical protein WR25_01958 isoform C [Diploscapter pachys]
MARQRSPSISTVISERSILIRTIVSIVVIIGVSITWALSTQFSKTAIKTNPDKFSAPYFMMFFSTSFMSMCYPVYMLYEFFSRHNVKVAHVAAQGIFGSKGWTILSWLKTVGPFLFLWICANYSYTRSLMSITPSIATSISATNTAIVYVLSILVLGDRFNIFKILSILFAIAGVVVISVDHSKLSAHFIGIILAIVSATSAAIYKVLLEMMQIINFKIQVLFKRQIGSASLGQVSLFMSSLGMLDLCVNWIPPLVLGLTDVEHIEFDYIPWAPMAIGACLSLLFNFLINFGIALLNPLTVSIGMLMGIPLNAGKNLKLFPILFRILFQQSMLFSDTHRLLSSIFWARD